MDLTVFLFLLQDALTNGAIYALLGLSLVLVFAVTRVIFIPQGEFVAYGALTLALLDTGRLPGTAWLLLVFGAAAFAADLWRSRRAFGWGPTMRRAAFDLAFPALVLAATALLAPRVPGTLVNIALTLLIVTPMGVYLHRIAFQPLAGASVLVLLIAALGVHLAMMGLGLAFFGAEGLRSGALAGGGFQVGPVFVTAQSLLVYLATIAVMAGLIVFFERTLFGKALRATAVNRIGARLVGIRTALAGRIAFALAALIGAVSGILIAPVTTVYYDTGFLIGLKGFVAAIIGALASYPLTALAALIVGLVEAFASFFASAWKEVIVFSLIIPVLLVRSLLHRHAPDED